MVPSILPSQLGMGCADTDLLGLHVQFLFGFWACHLASLKACLWAKLIFKSTMPA